MEKTVYVTSRQRYFYCAFVCGAEKLEKSCLFFLQYSKYYMVCFARYNQSDSIACMHACMKYLHKLRRTYECVRTVLCGTVVHWANPQDIYALKINHFT